MKQEFGYFLKNAKFRAALGLTLLLSYGYAIATTRVSIDSLEGDRYIGTGGVMLSTGRFGMNLWAAVLGYGRAEPSYAFGIDLLAALLLALAAVSFCALLRKAAQDRISMFGYGLFACLFVSYPLMNEIWEYSGANVCVCGGYLLDAAALNLLWDARQPGVPWRGRALRMGAAALCLMVVCSSYESLAAVYVLAVFALLTLEQLLAAERPRLAAVLTEGLWYAAALVGGLCLRVLVTSGIHLVLPPQAAANGATEILWAFYPFVYLAKLLVKSILINYALRGCFYLPIAELAVAALVFIVLVIALAVRKSGLCCCSPVRECCSHWCCCRLCREVLALPHLSGVCAVCGTGGAGCV
ncbi:glucosyltransferase domain-containing protein [Gemmiger formicilis]|nr:glucosyltransferase domain-containing protein [Gemmiger formicilis]